VGYDRSTIPKVREHLSKELCGPHIATPPPFYGPLTLTSTIPKGNPNIKEKVPVLDVLIETKKDQVRMQMLLLLLVLVVMLLLLLLLLLIFC